MLEVMNLLGRFWSVSLSTLQIYRMLTIYQQYIISISIVAPCKNTILQWMSITLSYYLIGFPICKGVKNVDINFRSSLKTYLFAFSVFSELSSIEYRSYSQSLIELVVQWYISFFIELIKIFLWTIWEDV